MPWGWWVWRSQNGKRLAPTNGPPPPRLTTRLKSSTSAPSGNVCACLPPSACNLTLKTALHLRGSYLSPGRTADLPIKTEKPLAPLHLWVRRRHASGFCICWARDEAFPYYNIVFFANVEGVWSKNNILSNTEQA